MKLIDLAKKLKNNPTERSEIHNIYGISKVKVSELLSKMRNSERYHLVENNGFVWVRKIRKPKRGIPITVNVRNSVFEKKPFCEIKNRAGFYNEKQNSSGVNSLPK